VELRDQGDGSARSNGADFRDARDGLDGLNHGRENGGDGLVDGLGVEVGELEAASVDGERGSLVKSDVAAADTSGRRAAADLALLVDVDVYVLVGAASGGFAGGLAAFVAGLAALTTAATTAATAVVHAHAGVVVVVVVVVVGGAILVIATEVGEKELGGLLGDLSGFGAESLGTGVRAAFAGREVVADGVEVVLVGLRGEGVATFATILAVEEGVTVAAITGGDGVGGFAAAEVSVAVIAATGGNGVSATQLLALHFVVAFVAAIVAALMAVVAAVVAALVAALVAEVVVVAVIVAVVVEVVAEAVVVAAMAAVVAEAVVVEVVMVVEVATEVVVVVVEVAIEATVGEGAAGVTADLAAGLLNAVDDGVVDDLGVDGLDALLDDGLDKVLHGLDDVDGLDILGLVDDGLENTGGAGADHIALGGAVADFVTDSVGAGAAVTDRGTGGVVAGGEAAGEAGAAGAAGEAGAEVTLADAGVTAAVLASTVEGDIVTSGGRSGDAGGRSRDASNTVLAGGSSAGGTRGRAAASLAAGLLDPVNDGLANGLGVDGLDVLLADGLDNVPDGLDDLDRLDILRLVDDRLVHLVEAGANDVALGGAAADATWDGAHDGACGGAAAVATLDRAAAVTLADTLARTRTAELAARINSGVDDGVLDDLLVDGLDVLLNDRLDNLGHRLDDVDGGDNGLDNLEGLDRVDPGALLDLLDNGGRLDDSEVRSGCLTGMLAAAILVGESDVDVALDAVAAAAVGRARDSGGSDARARRHMFDAGRVLDDDGLDDLGDGLVVRALDVRNGGRVGLGVSGDVVVHDRLDGLRGGGRLADDELGEALPLDVGDGPDLGDRDGNGDLLNHRNKLGATLLNGALLGLVEVLVDVQVLALVVLDVLATLAATAAATLNETNVALAEHGDERTEVLEVSEVVEDLGVHVLVVVDVLVDVMLVIVTLLNDIVIYRIRNSNGDGVLDVDDVGVASDGVTDVFLNVVLVATAASGGSEAAADVVVEPVVTPIETELVEEIALGVAPALLIIEVDLVDYVELILLIEDGLGKAAARSLFLSADRTLEETLGFVELHVVDNIELVLVTEDGLVIEGVDVVVLLLAVVGGTDRERARLLESEELVDREGVEEVLAVIDLLDDALAVGVESALLVAADGKEVALRSALLGLRGLRLLCIGLLGLSGLSGLLGLLAGRVEWNGQETGGCRVLHLGHDLGVDVLTVVDVLVEVVLEAGFLLVASASFAATSTTVTTTSSICKGTTSAIVAVLTMGVVGITLDDDRGGLDDLPGGSRGQVAVANNALGSGIGKDAKGDDGKDNGVVDLHLHFEG
jgi:hypothetical protein